MTKKLRLGDRLLEAGIIDKFQLRAALGQQGQWGKTLGRTLLEMRLITEEQLLPILSIHLNMPAINLDGSKVSPEAVTLLDEGFCRKHECIPFSYAEQGKFLDVAMTDAQSAGLFDQIRVRTRCNVRPFLAGPQAVQDAIDLAYGEDDDVEPQFMLTDNIVAFDEEAKKKPAPKATSPRRRRQSVVLSPAGPAPPAEESTASSNELIQARRQIVALREHIRGQDQYLKILVGQLRGLFGQLVRNGTLEVSPGHPLVGDTGLHPVTPRPDAAPPPPGATPPGPPVVAELTPLVKPAKKKRDSVEFDVDVIFDGFDPDEKEEPAAATKTKVAKKATKTSAPESPKLKDILPLVNVPADAPTVVAMDLGTTRCSVAAVVEGRVSVLKLPGGAWDMPSIVGFRHDGSVMLGKNARKMLASDPANAIASPKRLLGRRYEEQALQPYLASLGMVASRGNRGEVTLAAQDKTITVTEVCAHLLNLLRLIAEKNLGHEVHEVILTTPVSFTDRQYTALTEAAELADLRVLELVDEPVAATLACVSDPSCKGLVAVFDFGGGTFDFSVVDVGKEKMEVVVSAGDSWLGGDDFDEVLAKSAANEFWHATEIELRNQAEQWQRLLVRAELAKRALSDKEKTTLELPEAGLTADGPLDLVYPISRPQFAELSAEIVQRALDTCKEALELNDFKPGDLSAVYLSGGTTYIPCVRSAVARFFQQEPRIVVPPEHAVLVGAAVHGAMFPQEMSAAKKD